LCFDDARETRMSLQDPMKGHFEYTEYFTCLALEHAAHKRAEIGLEAAAHRDPSNITIRP